VTFIHLRVRELTASQLTESSDLLQEEVARRKQAEEEVLSLDAKLKQINDGMAVARRQLQETQSIQKAILDGIPDLVWLKDRESRFIAANRPFGLACGVLPEDLTGKTDLDIWPRELAERYREDDRQVMESGRVKRVEEPLSDSQGRRGWIETIKVPVTDGRGQVIGTVGIARDITDRKLAEDVLNRSRDALEVEVRERTAELEKANEDLRSEIEERKRIEEELRRSHELLLQYIRHSPIYTFIKEVTPTESRVLHVSDNFEQMVGIPARDMAGKTMTELFPAEFAAKITDEDWGVVSRRTVLKLDEELDGRHYTSIKFPIVQGDRTLLAGYTIDITEKKRAEEEKLDLVRQMQQAQKLESLGVLAGGIAHDFNNLLMVVLGNVELALDEIPPMSPVRLKLTEITTAARRAADLSQQMLAYAGKSSFALERVVLGELVEEMAHLLKAGISKKAILNLNLERGLPPIQADPSQIRQIAMNLIINASEAIGDGDGEITVSLGTTRCDEGYLRRTETHDNLAAGLYVYLEVTDTGYGMDSKTRARIFEPFFSTKFTGRGLGLAAVQGIVRAHKGALIVSSEPGKGTTFKVLFPALEDAAERVPTDGSSTPDDWQGTGTILLVDDEQSLVALGARMLEHLGFTVLTAADGREALELYRERGKEIDLVLMDLTMPHMDGMEALAELRRLNPDVRVVVASGYSHEDVESRFAGKGIDGVLQKPYTLAKMREALAGVIPKRP